MIGEAEKQSIFAEIPADFEGSKNIRSSATSRAGLVESQGGQCLVRE